MTELSQILLTSSLTIICGVIVFSTQQIISKFIIEPIHEQRKVIGEIADALIFYANVYGNPGLLQPEAMDEACKRLRQLSTLLQSKTEVIPYYFTLQKIGWVIKSETVKEVCSQLIYLSNSIHQPARNLSDTIVTSNLAAADRIKKALKLKI